MMILLTLFTSTLSHVCAIASTIISFLHFLSHTPSNLSQATFSPPVTQVLSTSNPPLLRTLTLSFQWKSQNSITPSGIQLIYSVYIDVYTPIYHPLLPIHPSHLDIPTSTTIQSNPIQYLTLISSHPIHPIHPIPSIPSHPISPLHPPTNPPKNPQTNKANPLTHSLTPKIHSPPSRHYPSTINPRARLNPEPISPDINQSINLSLLCNTHLTFIY